jgi:hypothetical protein
MATEQDIVNSLLGMTEVKAPLQYDPEKLIYNQKYKSFEYFAKKFPPGWQSIPGFDKVIDLCRQNATNMTPEEEMDEKIEIGIEHFYNNLGKTQEEIDAQVKIAVDNYNQDIIKKYGIAPSDEQFEKVIKSCQEDGELTQDQVSDLKDIVNTTIDQYKEYIDNIDVTINQLTDNTSDLN